MIANDSSIKPVLYIARGGELDGAERQLSYLVQDLDRSRFKPVVALDAECPLAQFLRARGIEVHVLPMRPWRSLRGALMHFVDAHALSRLARKRNIALVHASDLWKSRYAIFVSKRNSLPTVIHIRGPVDHRALHKHRLADASALIAISQRYQEDLANIGAPSERIHLIDDAVDLTRFNPATPGRDLFRQRHNVGSRIAVGLVGRVEANKRILEFLEIAALAERRAPSQALYFVIGQNGPESYMREVRAAVTRLALQNSVIFTGRIDDMPPALAGLDILVSLSGGSVMFEAMACSKTLLSVRHDTRPTTHTRHNETAWFAPADNPANAVDALLHLIADADLRTRLGQTAAAWISDHLSRQQMAARTQALYEQLLNSGTPKSPPAPRSIRAATGIQ